MSETGFQKLRYRPRTLSRTCRFESNRGLLAASGYAKEFCAPGNSSVARVYGFGLNKITCAICIERERERDKQRERETDAATFKAPTNYTLRGPYWTYWAHFGGPFGSFGPNLDQNSIFIHMMKSKNLSVVSVPAKITMQLQKRHSHIYIYIYIYYSLCKELRIKELRLHMGTQGGLCRSRGRNLKLMMQYQGIA